MPSPSSSLATLRPDLAESFEQFDLMADAAGLVAQKVCPIIDVMEAAGNFGIIPVEQLLQSPDLTRSPGSGYNRGKFTFKASTYATHEYGYEEQVDDNEAKMYANYFTAERMAAARAYSALLRGYETRVASLLFNTAVFTNTGAVHHKWNDSDTSLATPLSDIETAIQAVYPASGLWPNVVLFNKKAFRYVRRTDQITNLIKYSGNDDPKAKALTEKVLSDLFAIEEVVVAGSSYNSANQGQTAAVSQIWSDSYCWVGVVARGEDFKQPCAARTFHWAGDGSTIGGTFETYRDEPIRSDIVRIRHQVNEQLLYASAGYLLSGVIA